MLAYKPGSRISAATALSDPWIAQYTTTSQQGLSRYNALALRNLYAFEAY